MFLFLFAYADSIGIAHMYCVSLQHTVNTLIQENNNKTGSIKEAFENVTDSYYIQILFRQLIFTVTGCQKHLEYTHSRRKGFGLRMKLVLLPIENCAKYKFCFSHNSSKFLFTIIKLSSLKPINTSVFGKFVECT